MQLMLLWPSSGIHQFEYLVETFFMTIPCISLLLLTAVTSGYHLTYKYINNFQIASQVCSIRNNSSVKLYVVIPLLKTQSKSQSLDNAKPGPRVQFHPVSPGHPITHVRACCCFSRVWLFVTPWTAARQAPLSMGLSRQQYWSGLPCAAPGDLPNPGIESVSFICLYWQAGSLPLVASRRSNPAAFALAHRPAATLNTSGKQQPQGLCAGCSLCLTGSPPRNLHWQFPQLLGICTNVSSSIGQTLST